MKRRYFCWIVLSALFLFCVGCGVKAYPKYPKEARLPAVTDLGYQVESETLVLSWTLPDSKEPEEGTDCVIYRSLLKTGETLCETCPIPFERIARVSLVNAEKDDDGKWRMHYSTQIQPGMRYRFKVNLAPESGSEGEDSNIVRIDH